MTTASEATTYTWDALLIPYLEEQQRRHRRNGEPLAERVVLDARKAIEWWRTHEWPSIKRDLAQPPFRLNIADHEEPCWVGPGTACLWQQRWKQGVVSKMDDQRRPYREIVNEVVGWEPTTGISITTASQLAGYLRNGLRLRPPGHYALEAALQPAPTAPPTPPPPNPYFCGRHPEKGGLFTFPNWEGYLAHCRHHREVPDQQPPREVVERARKYPYFCFIHNVGFDSLRGAEQHVREGRRSLGALHPTTEQMSMKEQP